MVLRRRLAQLWESVVLLLPAVELVPRVSSQPRQQCSTALQKNCFARLVRQKALRRRLAEKTKEKKSCENPSRVLEACSAAVNTNNTVTLVSQRDDDALACSHRGSNQTQ